MASLSTHTQRSACPVHGDTVTVTGGDGASQSCLAAGYVRCGACGQLTLAGDAGAINTLAIQALCDSWLEAQR
jgi:hypothetical protein